MEDRDQFFERLYNRYFEFVVSIIAGTGIPRQECLDLAQDTFLNVYRGLDSFDGRSSLQTWIAKVAKNIALNDIRYGKTAKRSGVHISIETKDDAGRTLSEKIRSHEDLHAAAENRERIKCLEEALKLLPQQMRRCALHRFGQDLTYREIASLLQISIQTVKSHLHQARKRLIEHCREYFSFRHKQEGS